MDPSTPVPELHDAATCDVCESVRQRVLNGDLTCTGSGDPCELCTASHRR